MAAYLCVIDCCSNAIFFSDGILRVPEHVTKRNKNELFCIDYENRVL